METITSLGFPPNVFEVPSSGLVRREARRVLRGFPGDPYTRTGIPGLVEEPIILFETVLTSTNVFVVELSRTGMVEKLRI